MFRPMQIILKLGYQNKLDAIIHIAMVLDASKVK